jgi:hypothetical protein
LRPKKILGLEIRKARHPEWTEEEKKKLMDEQMQGNLFSEEEAKRQINTLRKIPFDFYYYYVCDTLNGEKKFRHKIADWEAGALFWNCRQSHDRNWEPPFRAKLENELSGKDLMFIMGNLHRFQNQWIIVSLIYPPRRKKADAMQASLL